MVDLACFCCLFYIQPNLDCLILYIENFALNYGWSAVSANKQFILTDWANVRLQAQAFDTIGYFIVLYQIYLWRSKKHWFLYNTQTYRFTAIPATWCTTKVVFFSQVYLLLPSCSKTLVSTLNMPTQWWMSHNTHSWTNAYTCMPQHFIYFQGTEGTQDLLLESTEAFYRTALRQGHCATQAHSDRSLLTPPYTPMGDNGKGGYILPRRRGEEWKGKKASKRSGRIEALSRSSISPRKPPLPPLLFFTLLNPSSPVLLLSCYLGGVLSNAHTHPHIL